MREGINIICILFLAGTVSSIFLKDGTLDIGMLKKIKRKFKDDNATMTNHTKEEPKPVLNNCKDRNATCQAGWYHLGDMCFIISDFTTTFRRAGNICLFKESELMKISPDLEAFVTEYLSNKSEEISKIKNETSFCPSDNRNCGNPLGFTKLWVNQTEVGVYGGPGDNASHYTLSDIDKDIEEDEVSNTSCVVKTPNGWDKVSCDDAYIFACVKRADTVTFLKPLVPRLTINGHRGVGVFPSGTQSTVLCSTEATRSTDLIWRFFFRGDVEGSLGQETKWKREIKRRKNTFLEYACVEESYFMMQLIPFVTTLEISCFSEKPSTLNSRCSPDLRICDTIKLFILSDNHIIPRMTTVMFGKVDKTKQLTVECRLDDPVKPTESPEETEDEDYGPGNEEDDKFEDESVITWVIHLPYRMIYVKRKHPYQYIEVSDEKDENVGKISRLFLNNVTSKMDNMTVVCYSYDVHQYGLGPCTQRGLCARTQVLRVKSGIHNEAFNYKGYWINTVFITIVILMIVVAATCRFYNFYNKSRPSVASYVSGRSSSSYAGNFRTRYHNTGASEKVTENRS